MPGQDPAKRHAGLRQGRDCPGAPADPRGPGWLLAGLCAACGKATCRRWHGGPPHCWGQEMSRRR